MILKKTNKLLPCAWSQFELRVGIGIGFARGVGFRLELRLALPVGLGLDWSWDWLCPWGRALVIRDRALEVGHWFSCIKKAPSGELEAFLILGLYVVAPEGSKAILLLCSLLCSYVFSLANSHIREENRNNNHDLRRENSQEHGYWVDGCVT